jgi:hypothetical protein
MRIIVAMAALLALALAACGGPSERDYDRAPGTTTVIERPGSTVIIEEPSRGAPLRLCNHNQTC